MRNYISLYYLAFHQYNFSLHNIERDIKRFSSLL